jgi:hypothetical protein
LETIKLSTFELYTLGARFDLSSVEEKFRGDLLRDFSLYTVARLPGSSLTLFECLALSRPLKAAQLAQDAYRLLQEELQVY